MARLSALEEPAPKTWKKDIHARGTTSQVAEKRFGVYVTPDKEMILILVKETIRDQMLSAIYKAAGLGTDGQGIAFSLPVNDVVGIKI